MWAWWYIWWKEWLAMWSYPLPPSDPILTTQAMAIMDRYFSALETKTADMLLPDPGYQWRFYKGLTLERLRTGLIGIDDYLDAQGQVNWATEHEKINGGGPFDAGPGLNRLPDAAVWAMFQELDTLFASHPLQPNSYPVPPEPEETPHGETPTD